MKETPQFTENKVEQKEFPKVSVVVVDDGPMGRALQQVLGMFGPDVTVVPNEAELKKILQTSTIDTVFFTKGGPQTVRAITKTRNNPDLEQQPVILAYEFNQKGARQSSEAGADITMNGMPMLVEMLQGLQSIPELLGKIEDQYGEKMLRNKQGFYKEYKEKLEARSKETADTEQELGILQELFEQNEVETVLDAGGGAGRLAIPLTEQGYSVTNVDGSPELLKKMQEENVKIKAIQADLRRMPIEDESFDAVTFNWHVLCDLLGNKGKRQALGDAYRVLKPGGVIALDIPDRSEGEMHKDGVYINYPGGDAVFVGYIPSEEEVVKLLEDSRFEDVKIKKWKTKTDFPKISFQAKKQ